MTRVEEEGRVHSASQVQLALLEGKYRGVDAVFDDVARVYRDVAQAAPNGQRPELAAAKLCVQLCHEVMEDAATSVGVSFEHFVEAQKTFSLAVS